MAEGSQLYKVMDAITQADDFVEFSKAHDWVSAFKEAAGYTDNQLKGRLEGAAKKLGSLIEGSMEGAAKKSGSDVYDMYRQASEFTKTGHKVFDDALIRRIAETEPEKLGETLFRPETTESLRRMKASLSPRAFMQYHKGLISDLRTKMGPESFRAAMRSGLESLFASTKFTKVDAQAGGNTFFKGSNLLENIRSFGEGTLETALGKEAKDAVMQFARVASRIETKEPRIGLWGMTQLLTGGGATITNPIAGGSILLTPAIVAKMLTSKTGRTLLTEGYKIQPGTRQATILMSRFGSFMASQGVKEYQRFEKPPTAPASSTGTGSSVPPWMRRNNPE
jgi:hypothetical protein